MNAKKRNALVAQGAEAAKENKSIFDCPYSWKSESAMWWCKGFKSLPNTACTGLAPAEALESNQVSGASQ